LKRFLIRDLRDVFQKRQFDDTPAVYAQFRFAGGTFQLRIFSAPQNFPRSRAPNVLTPLPRQPFLNWDAFEIKIEIDAPILARARSSFGMNNSSRVANRLQIKIVKREQFFGDEQMGVAQLQIWNQRHL